MIFYLMLPVFSMWNKYGKINTINMIVNEQIAINRQLWNRQLQTDSYEQTAIDRQLWGIQLLYGQAVMGQITLD